MKLSPSDSRRWLCQMRLRTPCTIILLLVDMHIWKKYMPIIYSILQSTVYIFTQKTIQSAELNRYVYKRHIAPSNVFFHFGNSKDPIKYTFFTSHIYCVGIQRRVRIFLTFHKLFNDLSQPWAWRKTVVKEFLTLKKGCSKTLVFLRTKKSRFWINIPPFGTIRESYGL